MFRKFRMLMDQASDPNSGGGSPPTEETNPLFSALFDDSKSPVLEDDNPTPKTPPVSLNDIPLPEKKEDEPPPPAEKPKDEGDKTKEVTPPAKKKVVVKLGDSTPPSDSSTPPAKSSAPGNADTPPPADPPKPPAEDDPFVNNLLDEEKQRYDLAKKAEQLSPEFKGLAKKYLDFAKEVDEYTKKKLAEDDEYDFQSDKTFKDLAKKNPLTPQLEKKIEREEIKAEILSESRREIEEVRRQQFVSEQKPQVDQMLEQFKESTIEMLPDYFAKAIEEEGLEVAKEKYPLEFDLADQHAAATNMAVREFLEVSRGLKPFDPANNLHQAIYGFISKESKLFLETAKPEELERDGKKFLPREDFAKLKPDERQKYWTLSNQQILKLVRMREKEALAKAIETEKERLKRYGVVPQPTQPKQPTQPPKRDHVPAAGRTVIPPSGEPPNNDGDLKSPVAKMLFG